MTAGEDDSLRKDIEEIKAAGNKAAALTSQLLTFSRKQVIQPIILDINEALKDLEKMFSRLIREDIEIKMTLSPGPCLVKMDPTQIEQVIMNLSINARDAMPHGGMLTIETKIVELDDTYFHHHAVEGYPGSFVMLSVTDTGIGIDKETQSRIFEPFFTTKEKGKGTGLGLSSVYGIVKQNDGFTWVYSEPGQGTVFKIYLPNVVEDVEVVRDKEVSIEKLRGSETVLVVEDDEMVLNFIRKSLKGHGYQILEAQNGQQALQVIEEYEGTIHIVVTDVVMPKMSGRELARHLQKLSPEMKVLCMSGYSDNAITRHGILEKGVEFIQKPLTPESLLLKLREVLDYK
jgi:CheY-like chemotaxis protein